MNRLGWALLGSALTVGVAFLYTWLAPDEMTEAEEVALDAFVADLSELSFHWPDAGWSERRAVKA